MTASAGVPRPAEAERGATPRGGWLAASGFGLLLALTAFAAFVHHGIGPPPARSGGAWHAPNGFLLESEALSALLDPPALAVAILGLPACMLAAGVFLCTRSALARALALSAVAAVCLFAFYGLVAPFPWRFFGWRGSAVLVLVSLVLGFAAAAPLLAASWLRLAWPWRLVTYLPFVVFVVAFLRNATGTDPDLAFAISPWPAVPVFGLEVAALLVAIWLLGTAIGVAGVSRGAASGRGALAIALGLATPLLLLLAGSGLGLFPFRLGPRVVGGVVAACGLAIAAAALAARDRRRVLPRRARHLAAGAALVGIPLVAGQAWAYLDYYVARHVQAQRIIDGLQAYRERESLYPDSLEELVEAGLLDEVPEPAIGFDLLYDGEFRYQSFGTSFLLEFPAPRWVQCAYTPAAALEDFEDEADLDEEGLGESWSCPSRPPELW